MKRPQIKTPNNAKCWCCGGRAREMHHVYTFDFIKNSDNLSEAVRDGMNKFLLPLCRPCHTLVGQISLHDWPTNPNDYLLGLCEIVSTGAGRRLLLKMLTHFPAPLEIAADSEIESECMAAGVAHQFVEV